MLRIAFVGAGSWASFVHGPALAEYAREHREDVELAAVCVRSNVERAHEFCDRFGFQRVYTDLDTMVEKEQPDACWVVTPIETTRQVVGRLLEMGVPVLFEKPPGANLQEAEELAELSRRTGTPNMVGFNRRWAPCTRRALAWSGLHGPVDYIYARMLRVNRLEKEFAYGTGIHALDCVRALAAATVGRIVSARTTRARSTAGAWDYHVDLAFASGAEGRCDIIPACGMMDEAYTLFGARHTIAFNLPWGDGGAASDGQAALWVEGELRANECYPLLPQHLSSGFYGETAEFIAALQEGRRPSPSAEESVESVAIAEAVHRGCDIVLG